MKAGEEDTERSNNNVIAVPTDISTYARLPKVAFIVTCYNYGRYLTACLSSILSQTHRNFECVIVDDGSTDDTLKVAERFVHAHGCEDRFRILKHGENLGQLAAFITGFKATSAPFISFVDADDMLTPDFAREHLRTHLHAIPVAFTCAMQRQIDGEGQIIGTYEPGYDPGPDYVRVRRQILWQEYWHWTTTSAMMFRRQVLDLVMPEEGQELRLCADNYICHLANVIGCSILIPQRLSLYRRHGENGFAAERILGSRVRHFRPDVGPDHEVVLDMMRQRLCQEAEAGVETFGMRRYAKMLAFVTPPAKLRTLDRGRLSGDLYRLVRKHSRLYALRRLLSIKTEPKPPRHLELTEDVTDAFGAVMPGARAIKSAAKAE